MEIKISKNRYRFIYGEKQCRKTGFELFPKIATANHSKRTFTLRYNGNKYRTLPMPKIEFNDALYNTAGDWIKYIKTNECIIIK